MRGQPNVERSNLCTPVGILVLDDVARNRTDAALPSSRIEPTRAAASRRKFIVDANDPPDVNAWPTELFVPVPVYRIDSSMVAPIAFVEASITELASCAVTF